LLLRWSLGMSSLLKIPPNLLGITANRFVLNCNFQQHYQAVGGMRLSSFSAEFTLKCSGVKVSKLNNIISLSARVQYMRNINKRAPEKFDLCDMSFIIQTYIQ
jgi:hypothetical protein